MKIKELLRNCLAGGLVFAMFLSQSVPVTVKASSDDLLSSGEITDFENDDEGSVISDENETDENGYDDKHTVISKQSGYISELKTVYDADGTKAQEKLEGDGYTVIDQDINLDSNYYLSKKRAVYLGYKTTNKASEAIRDVIALGQNDEYVVMDYDEILKNQYTDYAEIEDDFNVMITEFQQRYAEGSEMAKDAYGLLNAFYEDTSGLLLGDWFLQVTPAESTADNISPVMELITQVSQIALASIEMDFAFGLSTGEKTTESYVMRFSEMSSSDIRKAKNDASLYDRAAKLKELLTDFSQMVTKAEAYEEIPDDLTYDEFTEEQMSYAVDYYTLGLLNSYQYNGESLVSFLTSSPSIKNLYPLASVMTDAQVVAAEYIGLWDALKYETINYWAFEKLSDDIFPKMVDEAIEKNVEYIHEMYGFEDATSIYFSVDREPFEGKIAITKDAIDAAVSSGDYSALLSKSSFSASQIAEITILGLCGVGILTTLIIEQCAIDAAKKLQRELGNAIKEATYGLPSYDKLLEKYAGTTFGMDDVADISRSMRQKKINASPLVQSTRKKLQGQAKAFKVSQILQIAFAVIMIAVVIYSIYELDKAYNPTYDKTTIPQAVFHSKIDPDTGNTYYVRYRCVTDQNGDPADVNAYVGKAYKILYTTKQIDAGEPLEAEVIKLCIEDGTTVDTDTDGYLGIHRPGYLLETNLNEYVYNPSAPKIFIYFKKGSENHMLASFFSGTRGTVAAGMIGFVFGAAVCALLTLLIRKRKAG